MAVFTQGTQRIEVVVTKDNYEAATAGANTKNSEQVGSNAEGQAQGSANGGGSKSDFKRGYNFARINTTKVLAAGIMVGRLYANYRIGGIGYKNGDEAMQEAVQRNLEIALDGTQLASSVLIGATYGSAGGIAGSLIGATVGAVTAGASLFYKYKGKYREYDVKVFKEENGIEYRRARAQVSLTTGRLR